MLKLQNYLLSATEDNLILKSDLFKGLSHLLRDLSATLTIILLSITIVVLIIIAIKRNFQNAEDYDGHSRSGMGNLGKILGWTVLGTSASAVLNLVMSYFAK